MPDIFAAETEAKGFQPHRLVRDIACEDDEICPREPITVFLLDGPQQAPRLVEIGIVGPGVQRRETLITGARAAASIGDAISSRGMPRHADHQTAVMTPVSRPPVLAGRHQRGQVFLHDSEVEFFDLVKVVKPG